MTYQQLQKEIACDRALRNNAIRRARHMLTALKTYNSSLGKTYYFQDVRKIKEHINDARWLNREIIKHKKMIRTLQKELPI